MLLQAEQQLQWPTGHQRPGVEHGAATPFTVSEGDRFALTSRTELTSRLGCSMADV